MHYVNRFAVKKDIYSRDANIGFLGKPVIGFWKTGFKLVISFTYPRKNIVVLLYKANTYMYYAL